MSMTTHIIGFVPPDNRWKEMKKVYDACLFAGIEAPEEVLEFFNDEPPDDLGIEIDLEDDKSSTEYQREGSEGFQIELKKLPKEIKFIRFYNSY